MMVDNNKPLWATKAGTDKLLFKAVDRGMLAIDKDDQLHMILSEPITTPWHMYRSEQKQDCVFWDNVMKIPGYGKGQSFIPQACLNCWKVVIRPRTISELMKLLEVIYKLKRTSKCGIEMRDTVSGDYGGYFYNDTLEEAKDCYELVRKTIDEDISPDVPILRPKRGCTEYELGHGDSKDWIMFDGQEEIERYLEEKIKLDLVCVGQGRYVINKVHEGWIRWAYAHGDKTYLEFTNGQPLYPPYREY